MFLGFVRQHGAHAGDSRIMTMRLSLVAFTRLVRNAVDCDTRSGPGRCRGASERAGDARWTPVPPLYNTIQCNCHHVEARVEATVMSNVPAERRAGFRQTNSSVWAR